jgi:hypothetical protein
MYFEINFEIKVTLEIFIYKTLQDTQILIFIHTIQKYSIILVTNGRDTTVKVDKWMTALQYLVYLYILLIYLFIYLASPIMQTILKLINSST